MKISDLSNKNRSSCHWITFAAASVLALTLAGCGGGGSSDAPAAAPPAAVVPPVVTAPAVAVPTGTAPITLTATTPAATFAALTPAVPEVSVSISSPPKVTFSLTDGNGNAIKGFGSKAQSATATVASYPNIAFSLAKLVPGTGTAPSKWVSYIVTTVPTKNATTGAITASVPTRPTSDNTGTLVDNGNGTYTYTFYRDIAKAKADVAAGTETTTNKNADLGDLTYEPTLVHRLTMAISGNAPGTGTNTADGVLVTAGVPLKKPINVTYDFIPATGKAVTATDPSRDIVATAKCNECHYALGGIPGDSASDSAAMFHGGNRNNTKYCVVCHTDQRRYGRTEATTTATGFSGSTYLINGIAVGNFPHYIHKTHMGSVLAKDGYDFAGLKFETVHFPQDIRNCTKCHDGSDTSSAKTAQGDNWKNVPSRLACGACHDGISFVTGKGLTLKDKAAGLTTSPYGHVGGSQSDDAACALCHKPADINTYHIPVTPPSKLNSLLNNLTVAGASSNSNAAWIASNPSRLPVGAIKVTYDVQSVSRNASKQPVMVFRLLQDGVAKALNDPATKTEIWDNFMGSPSVYFVFAVPQDGVAAPADFNASASSYLRSLWNGKATGSSAGTLTYDATSGYYTATLTGVTIPDSAVMLSGGLGYSYNVRSALPLTQTNLASYPVAAAAATDLTDLTMPNKSGGLIVIAPNVQKVATGYTGRRTIVADALCNKCHQELGTFTETSFHGGQRNDGSTCAWCHNPNRGASQGWSVDSTYYVHAIHAGAKRTTKFTYYASSATTGFYDIHYPGVLKNCEACHVAGGYDYSTNAIASPDKRLYKVAATGTLASTSTTAFRFPSYVTLDNNYGAGFSFSAATGVTTEGAATNLVHSPTAAVCFACHDSSVARQHMESNGASIYAARGTAGPPATGALAKAEQCMFCHQPTSAFGLGIKAVHTIK